MPCISAPNRPRMRRGKYGMRIEVDTAYQRPAKLLATAETIDDTRHVYVYDEIGPWFLGMYGAESFLEDVDGHDGPLRIHINSPGGSVWEGFAIYSLLQQHGPPTSTQIDGIAASMGSFIPLATDSVEISPAGMMMVHKPWSVVVGDVEELEQATVFLRKLTGQIVHLYAAGTGNTVEQIETMMAGETWLTPDEAIEKGLAHRMLEPRTEPSEEEERAPAARWLSASLKLWEQRGLTPGSRLS